MSQEVSQQIVRSLEAKYNKFRQKWLLDVEVVGRSHDVCEPFFKCDVGPAEKATHELVLRDDERQYLGWLGTDVIIDIRTFELDHLHEVPLDHKLQKCLSTAIRVVEQAESITQSGVLQYLQDIASCHLTRCVVFIQHVGGISQHARRSLNAA